MGNSNSGRQTVVIEEEEDEIYVSFLDAASDGNKDGLQQIYEQADKDLRKKLLEFQDRDGNTALHFGSRKGHEEVVIYIIEQAEIIGEEF